MAIKHAAWTHELGIELESRSWSALRQGFYTTVRPSNEGTFGWVHFVIPTPVIVDGIRLKAESAMILFTTGQGAAITDFHVYDGEKKIADYNGLDLRGTSRFVREAMPIILRSSGARQSHLVYDSMGLDKRIMCNSLPR